MTPRRRGPGSPPGPVGEPALDVDQVVQAIDSFWEAIERFLVVRRGLDSATATREAFVAFVAGVQRPSGEPDAEDGVRRFLFRCAEAFPDRGERVR